MDNICIFRGVILCCVYTVWSQALYLDKVEGGMTFENMTKGQFPIYAALVMMALDCVLYGLLAVLNISRIDSNIKRPGGSIADEQTSLNKI